MYVQRQQMWLEHNDDTGEVHTTEDISSDFLSRTAMAHWLNGH
jgi:hypothetical protein